MDVVCGDCLHGPITKAILTFCIYYIINLIIRQIYCHYKFF